MRRCLGLRRWRSLFYLLSAHCSRTLGFPHCSLTSHVVTKAARAVSAVVASGQEAWTRLKEDAPRHRAISRAMTEAAYQRRKQSQAARCQWWIQVGEALIAGRHQSRSNQSYSAWLTAHGFDAIPYRLRQDAAWFASNAKTLGELPDGLANPTTIRRWTRSRGSSAARRVDGDAKGLVSTDEVDALRTAFALLQDAERDARRSMKAVDEAARLLYKVNAAIKRRGDA
ncbi:hypothetical protein FEP82_02792 [Burkholderia multivorans]|nr:hypothetical protein [Burkholderia multivorans]MDR8827626.1 hypothetical protein [Burkholderia multivorans]